MNWIEKIWSKPEKIWRFVWWGFVCVCCIEVDLEAHLSGCENQVWSWLNFWSGLLSLFLGSRFSRQKKQRTMMNDKITWKRLVHKVCRLCLSGDLSGDWSSLSKVDETFVSCKVPATYLDCRRIRMHVSTLWHVLPHHELDKKQATKPHQITTSINSCGCSFTGELSPVAD
jgi:hypothetical protein